MAIEFKCNCGSDYRLDDSRAGQSFTCRVCAATMTLPTGVGRATATEPAPVAAPVEAAAASAPAKPAAAPTGGAQTQPAPHGSGTMDTFGESLYTPAPSASSAPSAPSAPVQPPSRPAPAAAPKPQGEWTPGRCADDEDDSCPETMHHPPTAWCIGRLLMWAGCAGFLFLPWFSVSGRNAATRETVTDSVSGWMIVAAVLQRADRVAQPDMHVSMPSINEFTTASEGGGRVIAGGAMMMFGPVVYAGGLLLVVIFAPLAWARCGRGAVWPFVVCLLGLTGFAVGWHLIAGAEPFNDMLGVASQVGVSIGLSALAYTMLAVLVILCLIVRARPDFTLIRAMQWSEERTNSGPL